ncbi:MAG: hypothetical protein M1832_000989 [Thelocarpon impressellum]|nr:MAG: hypothetical protein M1832_000989 [Thelocarpon impressellum]
MAGFPDSAEGWAAWPSGAQKRKQSIAGLTQQDVDDLIQLESAPQPESFPQPSREEGRHATRDATSVDRQAEQQSQEDTRRPAVDTAPGDDHGARPPPDDISRPLRDGALQGEFGEESRRPTLDIADVDEYLARPEVVQLLEPAPPKLVAIGSPQDQTLVSQFYQNCQKRGLQPKFVYPDIATNRFSGEVTLGETRIVEEGPFPSKKVAKERLAERGLELLKSEGWGGIGTVKVKAGVKENWIELYQQALSSPGPVFTDFTLGTSFACECRIVQRREPFGGRTVPFLAKKAAKRNAAMEAFLWLRETGRAARMVQEKKAGGGKTLGPRPSSYVERVNEMCRVMHIPNPTFSIIAQNAGSSGARTAFFRGFAFFPPHTRVHRALIPDRVGEVRDVGGRGAARESCARAVYDWLMAAAGGQTEGLGGKGRVEGKEAAWAAAQAREEEAAAQAREEVPAAKARQDVAAVQSREESAACAAARAREVTARAAAQAKEKEVEVQVQVEAWRRGVEGAKELNEDEDLIQL